MRLVTTSLFLCVLILISPVLVSADQQSGPRLITVSGDAEVRVVPDEVELTLGVETSNKELNIAKKENDAIIQKVISAANRHKIENKHIQTDYLGIEPRYKNSYEQNSFIGYFVRKTVVITLTDIPKFETILSDVLEAGVNYVHGIKFRTTEFMADNRLLSNSLCLLQSCGVG